MKHSTGRTRRITKSGISILIRSIALLITAEKHIFDKNFEVSGWKTATVPSFWEETGLKGLFGVVWYRREFEVPGQYAGSKAILKLGNIIDEDTVYLNGTKIGSLPSQYIPRKYDIPEGVLKAGINSIVIRVVNSSAKGGFYKGKLYMLEVGACKINLEGEWKYSVGAESEPMPEPAFAMWCPSGLYNGMIAPMLPYSIKGAAWYQGESNTRNPKEYEFLLKALIEDWREKWGQGEFPFIFVQLPNYGEIFGPSEDNWALLREAQRKTLSVPATGMAVTIDIGEWNDVHPVNKKDVGRRLALAAQKVAYGEKTVVTSGPMFKSAERTGDRITVSFSDIGSGLVTSFGSNPGCFEISRADGKFFEADARIEGNCVIVWNEKVSKPVHVRYAWADNPEGANLYNREGLPASPFTTE